MVRWHSRCVDILSGMPNLKHLVLFELDVNYDILAKFFRRLSLKKLEFLSIQYCSHAREDFFVELSKLNFPELKKISFNQTWQDTQPPLSRLRNLSDNTLQTFVSKCPNLKVIQFGNNFCGSLSLKTLMNMFEKKNIFTYFGLTYNQFSMEQWFLKHDKNVYEKYQKLKPICMFK